MLPRQPGLDRRLRAQILRADYAASLAVPEHFPPSGFLRAAGLVPCAPAVQAITVLSGQARMAAATAHPAVVITPVEQRADHSPRGRLIDRRRRDQVPRASGLQPAALGLALGPA